MMELEERYLTFKIKDARNALSSNDIKILGDLIGKVEAYRSAADKEPLECLCIEKDWPEYEPALAMLSARVDGKPNEAKVAELEKDKVIFNLYYCEEFVGTFYQGSFSTEQKAIEARDHLLEKMKDMDWKTSDFIINEEAIDQAMKDSD